MGMFDDSLKIALLHLDCKNLKLTSLIKETQKSYLLIPLFMYAIHGIG